MAVRKRDFRHFGRARHPARRFLRNTILFLVLFFVGFTLINSMLLSTVSIGSGSMEPTLSSGDRVFATPIVFGARVPFTLLRFNPIRLPERGELVVCTPPFAENTPLERLIDPAVSFFTLQKVRLRDGAGTDWEGSMLVKRLIGTPGDTVLVDNFVAYVKPPGETEFLAESVLTRADYSISLTPPPENWSTLLPLSGSMPPLLLGEDEYFVLGDNRTQSHDSRHFGVLSLEDLQQNVLFRYWPLRRAGVP